jgi:O-acetylserine/cysteine efflux transporter
MKFIHVLLALMVVFIWGSAGVAIKPGLSLLKPFFFGALFFGGSGVILSLISRPSWAVFKSLFWVALVLGLFHNGLCLVSLSQLDAGAVSVALQTEMPFAALLAALVYKERMTPLQVLGILISFVGIFVFAGEPQIFSRIIPFCLAVLAAFMWAIANIQMKNLSHISSLHFISAYCLWTGIFFLGVSLLTETGHVSMLQNLNGPAFASLLYSGVIVTVLAYSAWQFLLKKYAITQVIPYILLTPIFGLGLGWFFLNEIINVQKILGGAIVILGVSLILIRFRKRAFS